MKLFLVWRFVGSEGGGDGFLGNVGTTNYLPHASGGYLHDVFFDPEGGGDIVLRKVRLSPNYLLPASAGLWYWLTGPEDVADIFFRNFGQSPNCTTLQPSLSIG